MNNHPINFIKITSKDIPKLFGGLLISIFVLLLIDVYFCHPILKNDSDFSTYFKFNNNFCNSISGQSLVKFYDSLGLYPQQ